MGTTAVVALVLGRAVAVASVGDSRAYLVGRNGHRRLTQDHTVAEMYAEMGLIRRDDVPRHPLRNVLVRSVGSPEGCVPDLLVVPVEAGDRLLLCSDGLTEMVEDDEIVRVVRESDEVAAASAELIGRALGAGGADNVTVIVIEMRG
jgi:protein phosphatase